jgi:hypothetical protein
MPLRPVLRHAVGHASLPAGNPQPAYKLEGMKILMEFPKPKDEEQAANAMPEVERKQVRHPHCRALHVLFQARLCIMFELLL